MTAPDRSEDSVSDVLSAVIDAHALSPDLRVGQLLLNTLALESPEHLDGRLYNIENRELARLIRKHANRAYKAGP